MKIVLEKNAFKEFVIGECSFSEGIAKKSRGAKEAERILNHMFEGKWDGIIVYG